MSLQTGLPVYRVQLEALFPAGEGATLPDRMRAAMARIAEPAAVATADVPADDGDTTRALTGSGFKVVGGPVAWSRKGGRPKPVRHPGLRFEPIASDQVAAAAALVAGCPVCREAHLPGLDDGRTEALAHARIARAARARRALVALSPLGEVHGVVSWRSADCEDDGWTPGAILLEHACVAASQRDKGLYEMLVRQALASGAGPGPGRVLTRLPMNEVVVAGEARALGKLGFNARRTRLRLVLLWAPAYVAGPGFDSINRNVLPQSPEASPPALKVPLFVWRVGGEASCLGAGVVGRA